jgi:hypothetical protein
MRANGAARPAAWARLVRCGTKGLYCDLNLNVSDSANMTNKTGQKSRAGRAALIAFILCLPLGFYLGVTLIGHARPLPYVSAWLDRLLLAGAVLGLPALAAWGAYRHVLVRRGLLAGLLFWGVGGILGLGALAFAAFYAWTFIEAHGRERDAARTPVGALRDEPIPARDGRPLGVRLAFAIDLPEARRAYTILPALYPDDNVVAGAPAGARVIFLVAVRDRVDGGPAFDSGSRHRMPELAPGRHEFVFEFYPDLVDADTAGEPCLRPDMTPLALSGAGAPARLRVTIPGTALDAGRGAQTQQAYDIAGMFRTAREILAPCPAR